MTIAEALDQATITLQQTTTSPRLDAEMLLAHVLGQDRAGLLINPGQVLSALAAEQLSTLILQRARHVPIPYLTGRQEFFGMSLEVTTDVLIPRPATELLVEAVLKHLPHDTTMTIADVGTGSGAIALALAKHLPQATIIASDLSPTALAVAKKNAHRFGLTGRITFVQSSLLKSYKLQADFIIANLPYLTTEQMAEPSIQKEPHLALDGGVDGLILVYELIAQAATIPTITGIALELDPMQVDLVRDRVTKIWPDWQVSEITDGTQPRGLIAWK